MVKGQHSININDQRQCRASQSFQGRHKQFLHERHSNQSLFAASTIPDASGILGTFLEGISARNVAKFLSLFFLLDSTMFALNSRQYLSKMYGFDLGRQETISSLVFKALGYVNVGMALIMFLMVSGLLKTSSRGIGIGLLLPLFHSLKHLMRGTLPMFAMKESIHAPATCALMVLVVPLLTNKFFPMTIAKIVSIIIGTVATAIYISPVRSVNVIWGIDVAEPGKEQTKACFKAFGKYTLLAAIFYGVLAFGGEPLRAVAYYAVSSAIMESHTLFITKSYKKVGTKTSTMLFLWLSNIFVALRIFFA